MSSPDKRRAARDVFALIPALWWMLRAQRLHRALPASELLRRLRAPAPAATPDARFGPEDGERMRVAKGASKPFEALYELARALRDDRSYLPQSC